jgi:hypothetical protein
MVTGHTGFKGSWLALWFHLLGANEDGISPRPEVSPNLFELAGIDQLCLSHFCDIQGEMMGNLNIPKVLEYKSRPDGSNQE